MKLNPKVTGGLAWAGLVVVLAVPGADMLTKQPANSANVVTTGIEPVRSAVVAPSPASASDRPAAPQVVQVAGKDPVVAGKDPVDGYLSSGKKLPSYISDAPADVAAAKPASTVRVVEPTGPAASTKPAVATAPQIKPVTAPATVAPVEVASVDTVAPVVVAPEPYPASMRPKTPQVIVTQPTTVAVTDDTPLIIDENQTARRDAAVAAVLGDEPVRLQEPSRSTARVVTEDELEEWDSGSLADYLERRGFMSEDDAQALNSEGEFDEDGFFLDEGPNESDGRRVIRRLPRRDDGFFTF